MSTSIKLPKYKIGLWDILFKGYPEFAHNVFMMNPERAIPKKEIDEAWSSLIRAKWEVWCATEADKKEEDGRQFLLDSGLEMTDNENAWDFWRKKVEEFPGADLFSMPEITIEEHVLDVMASVEAPSVKAFMKEYPPDVEEAMAREQAALFSQASKERERVDEVVDAADQMQL